MEAEFVKVLIGLGGPGILAGVMYAIAQKFIAAHAAQVLVTQGAHEQRIKALEEGHKECEAERQRLGNQLVEELRQRARERHHRRHGAKDQTEEE